MKNPSRKKNTHIELHVDFTTMSGLQEALDFIGTRWSQGFRGGNYTTESFSIKFDAFKSNKEEMLDDVGSAKLIIDSSWKIEEVNDNKFRVIIQSKMNNE